MTNLVFENAETTAEERFQQIMPLLHQGEVMVEFTKKDGTKRLMPCTLKAELIPPAPVVEGKEPKEKKVNFETITVWCTDKKEWRAFKTMNVISIKVS